MLYYLFIDDENNIIRTIMTFEKQDGVKLDSEEYKKTINFNKFNPDTREFYDPKTKKVEHLDRLDQIEQTIGILAEQIAKTALLGGNE